MKKVFFSTIFMMSIALAVETPIAWGFDYPIGNKGYSNNNQIEINEHLQSYNKRHNEEYNLGKNIADENKRFGTNPHNDWYNANDVGNFFKGTGGKGVHPGEDWNYRVNNTNLRSDNPDGTPISADGSGANVYAIADGVIAEISSVSSKSYTNRGWKIVIRHKLPDNTFVYSIYLHITSSDNNDGSITTDENDFTFQENDIVRKGNIIGKIASNLTSGLPSHLHFAIRNKFTSGSHLYDNANSNGYYTHDKKKHTLMEESQIITAFSKMKDDGIFDPSDFIDDHRNIYPWIGNGSIISYHGDNANQHSIHNITLDAQYPYGIKKDVTKTHTKLDNIEILSKQVGFFQWQPNVNCENIKISHTGINNNVDITIGHWGSRNGDKTYKNVTLPFVLGENNFKNNGTDWRVIAVTFKNLTAYNTSDEKNELKATCTNEPITSIVSPVANQKIMIGEHQWNGTASIISRIFKNGYQNYFDNGRYQSYADNWAFGVFHDVTVVHKNQYKPVVFFQWMSSDICEELVIDSTLNSSEKHVSLGVKNWAGNSYKELKVTLPYTIKSEHLWSVIKVAFDKPVSKDAKVTAKCKGL